MSNRALTIGINEYPSQPLAWAINDANALAGALAEQSAGYDVTTLTDGCATRSLILNAVRELAKPVDGNRLLFMAGHAGLTPHGARFISHGAVDWTDAISFAELAAILKSGLSGTSPLVVILDCCHAGALEIDASFTSQDLRDAISKDVGHPNVACLLACAVGGNARETSELQHGVFTYHLLNGLAGAAADSDGSVTTESLYSHIAKQLEKSSYPKPAYKASVTGRLVLLGRPSAQVQAAKSAELTTDIQKLQTIIQQTDATLASLRPPAMSRDEYRRRGWQDAAKAIAAAAEKRGAMLSRWGDELDKRHDWRTASEDVLSLLRDIANISPGTVTEYGTITEKLGEGGFGTVFRVHATQGSALAYKVFHPTELHTTAKLERFKIGYRAMNMLAHPRIVRVGKFLESPLSFYMDFVDGQNMRKWYGAVQEDAELINVLRDVVQTVEYAHGRGVIHRDIKPENVILTWASERARWEPCLTDFDLAWFPAATSHTVEAFGAPFYAAPEQLTDPGKSVAHQPAVDVYALAMLGTFLLTGRDPVSKDEAFSAVEVASRRWHSRTAASLLLDTLRRAGDRDPAKRIRLDEMRDALIEVSDSLIAAANPNAALGPADFFAQLGALLGYSGREATDSGPRAITYSSASERTGIDVVLVDGGFDVVFRKIDSFLAEGTSTTQARHALVRRVDGRMDTIKRLAPAGVGVQRRGGSGGVHVRVEFRNAELSPTVATFAARAIAVIVSICETF